jgi:hypothetical protein
MTTTVATTAAPYTILSNKIWTDGRSLNMDVIVKATTGARLRVRLKLHRSDRRSFVVCEHLTPAGWVEVVNYPITATRTGRVTRLAPGSSGLAEALAGDVKDLLTVALNILA